MAMRTGFRPETDAFAFDNSWHLDGTELEEIRRFLAREQDGLVRRLAESRLAQAIVRAVRRRHLLEDLMSDEHLTSFGLCGGMAFAALDYYLLGWVVPQGRGPDDHPADDAAGRALRNYIWQRLLDSMQSRAAATMLLWSLALHLVPRFGPAWVLRRTRQEWASLRRRLDTGRPWPIGLVGAAHGSFANHQVLAIGYDHPGDGTGSITVYDSCCPRSAHSIALDFRGSRLRADESCAHRGGDTQWMGFFCDVYRPARPPIALGLGAGITVEPGPPGVRSARYTARNAGFSPCPPLALHLARRGEVADLGGEEGPRPLDPGACRTLVRSLPPDGADAGDLCARAYLGTVDGRPVWKHLPALNRAAAEAADGAGAGGDGG